MRPWAIAAALVAAFLPGFAQALDGVVVRISDGDTLWVRPDIPNQRPVKVRIEGIDAPEACQDGGREARAALAARVERRQVHVPERGRDAYGRLLGGLYLGDEDISAWMVREGHAWAYRFSGRANPYRSLEDAARARRAGLFAGTDPLPPFVFRRMHGACERREP